MKKILSALIICGTLLIFPIASKATANASDRIQSYATAPKKETFAERCQRRQRENNQKWLDELEADGNLTQEAIDALGGKGRTPNKKASTKASNQTSSTGTSNSGKGWVYSVDELHVIGLPEGEDGYTLPGWYGDPEQ